MLRLSTSSPEKNIIVPRNKPLASHRSSSSIQWLKSSPLYLLWRTHGEPRHPSYKSHHERNFSNHSKVLSVRPELVEGLRERLSSTSRGCSSYHRSSSRGRLMRQKSWTPLSADP